MRREVSRDRKSWEKGDRKGGKKGNGENGGMEIGGKGGEGRVHISTRKDR